MFNAGFKLICSMALILVILWLLPFPYSGDWLCSCDSILYIIFLFWYNILDNLKSTYGVSIFIYDDTQELTAGSLKVTLYLLQSQLSSLHITFPSENEWQKLKEGGFLQRIGMQYHWKNRNYKKWVILNSFFFIVTWLL